MSPPPEKNQHLSIRVARPVGGDPSASPHLTRSCAEQSCGAELFECRTPANRTSLPFAFDDLEVKAHLNMDRG